MSGLLFLSISKGVDIARRLNVSVIRSCTLIWKVDQIIQQLLLVDYRLLPSQREVLRLQYITSYICQKKAVDFFLGYRAGYRGGGVTTRAALEILRKLVCQRNICVQYYYIGILLLRNVEELVLKTKIILVSFIASEGLDLALIKHY